MSLQSGARLGPVVGDADRLTVDDGPTFGYSVPGVILEGPTMKRRAEE